MSYELSSLGKEFKKNLEGGGKRIKNMELYTPLNLSHDQKCGRQRSFADSKISLIPLISQLFPINKKRKETTKKIPF